MTLQEVTAKLRNVRLTRRDGECQPGKGGRDAAMLAAILQVKAFVVHEIPTVLR